MAAQRVIETGPRKAADGAIQIEHAHHHTRALSLDNFTLHWIPAVRGREGELQRPGRREREILRAILIAESVARYHHGLVPMGNDARHVAADDGLAKNGAVQDVANGAVRAPPHLLQ